MKSLLFSLFCLAVPATAGQPMPNDCLILATEAYDRLRDVARWQALVIMDYVEGGDGHAVVVYEIPGGSLWCYDSRGSREMCPSSKSLADMISALSALYKPVSQIRVVMHEKGER